MPDTHTQPEAQAAMKWPLFIEGGAGEWSEATMFKRPASSSSQSSF